MSAVIFCMRCGAERCDCGKSAPARCYGCSVHTPGWVVGMRYGAPVHIACLDCNADGTKPRPQLNQPITAPS